MNGEGAGGALSDWDGRAGVRVKPRRLLEEREDGKVFFSPELVPAVRHPLLAERGAEVIDRLLVKQLYAYLSFTANFETRVVNRAAEVVANQRDGLDLPAPLRFDAFRIYCDESYHALYSMDIVHQVAGLTGVPYTPASFDRYLGRLQRVQESAPRAHQTLAQILLVVVFETMITRLLRTIPGDERVVSTVRTVVADHAQDEGRHHAYFSVLFRRLWDQLDGDTRRRLGVLLPGFIAATLWPETSPLQRALQEEGLDDAEVRQVVSESTEVADPAAEARRTAQGTLRLFEERGVFEDPTIRDAFLREGLLT